MNQKHVVVFSITLLVVGLAVGAYAKFKDELAAAFSLNQSSPQTPSNTDYFYEDKTGQKDPNSLTSPDQASTLNLASSPKPQTSQNPDVQGLKVQPTERPRSFSSFPGAYSQEQLKDKAALIETKKGQIYFTLFPQAPLASSNFIFLANQGFYDGLVFHRVERDFVVQGGDPLGNGTGGPGYKFADEKVIGNYVRAVVAMANSGPNTNGSQFFIVLQDQPTLPPRYTIFGQVIKGMEVMDKIEMGDVMEKVSIVNLVRTDQQ